MPTQREPSEYNNQKIKVLQLITRLMVGGAQETVMYSAALMDRERYEVDVVCGPQTGVEGSIIEETRAYGVRLTIIENLIREVHPLHDMLAFWKLYRYLKKNSYQVIHTNSSKAGILGRLAARFVGVPVIVHTIHGHGFHGFMSPKAQKFFIFLEKMVAPFTDSLVVVTSKDIDKALDVGIGKPDQFVLIRSALLLSEFDPTKENGESTRKELGIPLDIPVLGNVGRFSLQKNPLDWVRVAGRVAKQIPQCWFLLVGDGQMKDEVIALLKEEGIFDKTILTGIRRDVSKMLSAIDVFLLSSLWEGLPRVIPQSMSMKVPIIANRADGTIEAIQHGETGLLCEPGNLDEMAEFCVELLNDTEKRKIMGEKGREYSHQEFDIQVMINQLDELYVRLLKEKGCL